MPRAVRKPENDEMRRGLLAKIHIAKKDLALPDDVYRDVLHALFKKDSAKDLNLSQMESLVQHFQTLGWNPRGRKAAQAMALRYRAEGIAKELRNGEKRLAGMCKKICGADRVSWCHDPAKLQRLVAALEGARRQDLAEYGVEQ